MDLSFIRVATWLLLIYRGLIKNRKSHSYPAWSSGLEGVNLVTRCLPMGVPPKQTRRIRRRYFLLGGNLILLITALDFETNIDTEMSDFRSGPHSHRGF